MLSQKELDARMCIMYVLFLFIYSAAFGLFAGLYMAGVSWLICCIVYMLPSRGV